MKYVVLSVLSVSLLFATEYVDGELLDNPEGIQYFSTPEPLDVETLADINDPTSAFTYRSPIERAISREDEGSSLWSEQDWYNDIEIYPGPVGSGQDFDYDENTGHLYAVFDTDHATGDSLVVYRSMDGGETWSYFNFAYNTNNSISNPKIRLVRDSGGNSWVVIMGIWHETGDDQLWTRRFTTTGASATFELVTSNSVQFADMDADVGAAAHAYVTYIIEGTSTVRAVRNAVGGAGWVNDLNIYVNTGISNSHPAVAAGAGGNASIVFTVSTATSPEIRIKRTTNNGSSWIPSELVTGAGGWVDLDDLDIAYSRAATQIGWLTVTFEWASGDNFGYFLSNNSGVSWTWESCFAGGADENHGSIRAMKAVGHVTVAYNLDPGDSTMFTWANVGAPTAFTTPIRINDYVATIYWPATAGWNGGNYSAVLYTTFVGSSYALMYDWFGNTGIDDAPVATPGMIQNAPNPFNATTNISFNLTQNTPVTISIYNIAGQLVTTLADNQSFNEGSNSVQWDGQNESGTRVTPGVYFCRLNANGISQTHRMMMVR